MKIRCSANPLTRKNSRRWTPTNADSEEKNHLRSSAFICGPILLALLPLLLTAQQENDKSVSLSQVERKNKAPVSKELLKVKLPKPVEAKLDNGLTVLILENHKLPYISLHLLIQGAGPIGEPSDKAGLAAAAASLLTQGTASRTSRQIAEEVDLDGATLHASSSFGGNDANITVSGLSQTFDKWFALFTDILLHPTYPDAELNNYRQRTLIGLKQQRGQASFLASEQFNRAVYGVFPASVVSPSPAFLQAMTSADLQKWHDERYAPQNAILGITGDVNPQATIAMLKKSLAAWKRTAYEVKLPPSPPIVDQKHVFLVNRPGSVQTNIVIGNIAIDRRSPDYVAMRVTNQILGGGGAARLFMKLREEKGYTYGAYSTFTPLAFAGPWRAFSEVRTDVTDGSMTEFFNELNRIRTEKPAASELEDAKRSIVATFALSLEAPAEILQLAITQKRYGLPANYWDTYPTKIEAVTADDVLRTAKKYINPENAQIVAVGDAAKIKTVMQKYGPVTVYDSNGKEMPN
jgi:zinc protease